MNELYYLKWFRLSLNLRTEFISYVGKNGLFQSVRYNGFVLGYLFGLTANSDSLAFILYVYEIITNSQIKILRGNV